MIVSGFALYSKTTMLLLESIVFNNLNFMIMRMCHVIAFAGGLLAGGVIALMIAPKKGSELRKDIKDKMQNLKKQVDETIDRCTEGCCCNEKVNVTIEE